MNIDDNTHLSTADEEILRLATEPDEGGDDQQRSGDTAEVSDKAKADEGDDGEDGEDKGKLRSRPWSKRVDILTARNAEKDRRIAELEAQISGKAPAKDIATGPTLDEIMAKEPKPEDFEFGEADPEYLEARQDWKLDLRETKKAAETKEADDKRAKETEAETAAREVVEKVNTGITNVEKSGTEKYEDFEEKITAAVEARGGEPLPPLLSIGISISPVGADVAYKLASDETLSERIETVGKTNPQAAAILFGEIEGEFLESDDDSDLDPSDPLDLARMLGREKARRKGAGRSADDAARKITKAPKPADDRARGNKGQFEVGDDTEDFAAFERKYMGGKK